MPLPFANALSGGSSVERKNGAVAFLRAFLAETLAVGQTGVQHFKPHPGYHLVIDVVQVGLLALVHHVPQEADALDVRLAGSDQRVVDDARVLQRAFHDETVCGYRAEDVVHRRYCPDQVEVVHRTRQVEEDEVGRCRRLDKWPDRFNRVAGTAPHNRVGAFADALELLVCQLAQVRVALDTFQVAFAHVLDAELGIVAVHDRHVISLHVIQVTRHQYGECRFACSSLLGGEGDEQRFFFHAFFFFIC